MKKCLEVALIFLFSCAMGMLLGFMLDALQVAYAAPIAKQQQPGCTQFAKVGMWDVYHCVDPNGNEFNANSAGMMIPANQ